MQPEPPGPVALLFHEGRGAGASMVMVRVLGELGRRGWDLRAYVDRPGRLADLLEEEGVAVEGRERHVGFSLRWLRHSPGPAVKLRSMPRWFGGVHGWLRRTRPALVHANSLYALPEALLARSMGLPTYLQVMEMLPEGRKGAAARRVVDLAGIEVGAVSRACATRFAGGGRLPHIVLTGVPLPDAAADRPAHPSPPVVGTIGFVCERKGTDLFVAAARRVLEQRPDVEFRIVGINDDAPGFDWGEQVLDEARRLGVRQIEGADGLQQLQGFDLLVLPSRYDPYPLTVMEAMASGVPVVGTAVDGIVEQVVPGTGLLARPEDPDDLAARILELLDDDPRRRTMAAAAREHAKATFRLDRQADQQELAWRATLARR